MTTIFNFVDNTSVVADTIKEALSIRNEEIQFLDKHEKRALLEILKDKKSLRKEEVPDFHDLNEKFHVCEQDPETTESRHNHMLETYGKDLDKAKLTDPNHIWTIVDGDNGLNYICPGFHFVNRVGYLQTLKPWKSEEENFLW